MQYAAHMVATEGHIVGVIGRTIAAAGIEWARVIAGAVWGQVIRHGDTLGQRCTT